MSNLPELGVGLVWFPGLEHLLEAGGDLIDVLEIEPEAFWIKTPDERGYRIHEAALEHLRAFPQRKLLHGVGFPIGGTIPPDPTHVAHFVRCARELDAAWVSEHLSFNRVPAARGAYNPGFLLPPIQTPESVRQAARNIRALRAELDLPFAFETGVSYLQPQPGELSDGVFFAGVAEGADCGIVLDLHNLWCNERNGRTSVADVLAALPLERVHELHLAGGQEYEGYWLDAHSGLVPPEVRALAADLVPRLPHLKAILFEVMDDYVHARNIATSELLDQFRWMRAVWNTRGTRPCPARRDVAGTPGRAPAPAAWERALGSLVVGRAPVGRLAEQLATDPGVAVVRTLVQNVRAGMTVEALRLTYRYLALALGEESARSTLALFWRETPPETFTLDEARHFVRFLEQRALDLPDLGAVARYELAAQLVTIDGRERTVTFDTEPNAVLTALGTGQLPGARTPGTYELTITA